MKPCPKCEGKGQIVQMRKPRTGNPIKSPMCEVCKGYGTVPDEPPKK